MYNVDGPKIFSSETVNIAGREGQIPVSFSFEHNWEALALAKDCSTGLFQ